MDELRAQGVGDISCTHEEQFPDWFLSLYGEMKRGQEFPSVISGQLHSIVTSLSMSPIPSPTPSAPSPRANEATSQGTLAFPRIRTTSTLTTPIRRT
ncbi:hypothetical protein CJ030_MR7G008166 [Morella rubra]|uniref:Uncharacterized protein n=1 Tax=Morella rubra TaxID=262757 RepID=A0A6A1V4R7_9ROSI|nr:hypothetical protein CJ030_MR7G008166 [Morella rubra]